MSAYTAAIELGADMLEADVRLSRDGRLILLHDSTVDRTTDGRGEVGDFTWSQLRQLDGGSWFAAEFAGERVPCLDELFDLADAAGVRLCLEAKGESDDARTVVAVAVASALVERRRLECDVLASFDHGALATAAGTTPGLCTAPERLPERGQLNPSDLVAQARRIGAEIIQHHHADLVGKSVDAVHEAGMELWVWPTTSPEDIARAVALGADGLMGGDVLAMKDTLSSLRPAPGLGHDDRHSTR
ncbi:glycerophosphodiester phosphodiesterase [Kribbella ginsengisoli]|uniref:Glycerophosphodiester phosphodiesterase n=2 Tax=Kribbella ginsengisoli TaxID=363865 RepID=A0ABP6Z772_9ACTN